MMKFVTFRIGDRIIANGQTVQDHHICQSHHCHVSISKYFICEQIRIFPTFSREH